jgi:hypothetical protein
MHGIEVVTAVLQTITSGHQAAPLHLHAYHLHGTLVVVIVSFPSLCGWCFFLMTHVDNKPISKPITSLLNDVVNSGLSSLRHNM